MDTPWASDTTIPLGGITTVDLMYMISDQACTINLNSSSGTDITIDPNKPLVLSGTAVTAIYISQSSGSTANVKYLIAGA